MARYNILGITKAAMPLDFTQPNVQTAFCNTANDQYNHNIFGKVLFIVTNQPNAVTGENNFAVSHEIEKPDYDAKGIIFIDSTIVPEDNFL